MPLFFEKNQGQFAPSVHYVAREARAMQAFETRTVLWHAGASRGPLLRMSFANANPSASMEGLTRLSGKVNYLSTSIRDVECFSAIRYRDLFPGVNVDFRSTSGTVEYDVIVRPGGNPASVRFVFSGATSSRVTASGDLVFETSAGPVRHHAPVSWQIVRGERKPVTARFVLQRRGPDTEVEFAVEAWDRTAPLTIDPVVTYDRAILQSETTNANAQVRLDRAGDVYLMGRVYSISIATIGQLPGLTLSLPFVAKLKADGSDFLWFTYLASQNESYRSFEVDSTGNVWLAGDTASATFATTPNAVQKISGNPTCTSTGNPFFFPSCTDGIVVALNSSGSGTLYSTYMGGSGNDSISGIALAGDGTVWVTGVTSSTNFPVTTGAAQGKLKGTQDAFLAHIDPQTPNLLYSTYFGGSEHEISTAIAIDASNNVFVEGATDSVDFPTTASALQPAYGGGTDVFFAKFSGSNTRLLFSTYWGGATGEMPEGLTVDTAGNLVAVFAKLDSPYPLGVGIAFIANPRSSVVKIDSTGGSVVWSNQLLATIQEVAVDPQGRISVLGRALSPPALTPNALGTCPGAFGLVFLRFEADGGRLLYGSGVQADSFALDPAGAVYFAGGSRIQRQDFSTDPPMAATCIHGAAQLSDDAVAPGEIISIYGRNIGPATGAIGAFDSSGRLPFTLGGVSVTFDGAPAPLLYAQAGQINAIVPFKVVSQKSAAMQITVSGILAPPVRVSLRDGSNIAVSSNGLVAAINEDGTVNSNDHPAKPGSVVTIYSSGGGQTNPASVDGQIADRAAPLVLPTKVLVGSGPSQVAAEVHYAGAAPGLIAGTVQINFRVPRDVPPNFMFIGYPNQNIAILIGDQTTYFTSGSIFVK